MKKKPNITIFFPVYNDENTVRRVAEKSLDVLSQVADKYEVIIINDGSPDRSGEVADEVAAEYPEIRVIHHEVNKGYGAAVKTGLAASQYEWICFTDGDDEYDVYELKKMIPLLDFYQLIITFRFKRLYSSKRIFISKIYNWVFRLIYKTPYRDISTGFRVISKHLADTLNITSDSPFIGAEITVKSMLRGYPVGEVGIQTFPREFGIGASVSSKNIMKTINDMIRVKNEVFSPDYNMPDHRKRPTDLPKTKAETV